MNRNKTYLTNEEHLCRYGYLPATRAKDLLDNAADQANRIRRLISRLEEENLPIPIIIAQLKELLP